MAERKVELIVDAVDLNLEMIEDAYAAEKVAAPCAA